MLWTSIRYSWPGTFIRLKLQTENGKIDQIWTVVIERVIKKTKSTDNSYSVMTTIKRIMIVGQPGSGKSTLAQGLGRLLTLPVVHMDRIHWQSGWIERSGLEKDRLCSEIHNQDSWIFEGGRSSERLQRADILIWLDFPLTVRAWRVFLRTLRYHGRTRPDLPDGCPERFNLEFAKWIWSTRSTGKERLQKLFDSAPVNMPKHRVQNLRQVEELISILAG